MLYWEVSIKHVSNHPLAADHMRHTPQPQMPSGAHLPSPWEFFGDPTAAQCVEHPALGSGPFPIRQTGPRVPKNPTAVMDGGACAWRETSALSPLFHLSLMSAFPALPWEESLCIGMRMLFVHRGAGCYEQAKGEP